MRTNLFRPGPGVGRRWLAFGLWGLLACLPARAVDYYWTNVSGGTFSTPGNWAAGNIVPGIADNARFTSNATYTLTLAAAQTNANASFDAVRDGNVTVGLGGFTWTVTNGFAVSQAANTTNVVLLSDGSVICLGATGGGTTTLGWGANSASTLILANGAALVSTNNVNHSLEVAFAAGTSGTLAVSNGARGFTSATLIMASALGSRGAVNLFGGTNLVSAAGSGAAQIGYAAGATGSVLVVGNGTQFVTTNGGTRFGVTGNASGTISNGGTWLAAGISMGYGNGNGTLVVTNGGRLISSSLTAGNGNGAAASSNNLLVVGGGSLWANSGALTIGSIGASNTVWVADPGTVFTNGGNIALGNSSGYVGNRLVVSNRASAYVLGSATIGAVGTANGNSVVVSGSGTYWSNTIFTVGGVSALNQLVISDGARVLSVGAGASSSMIGSGAASSNNLVLVTGSNSFWFNGGTTFYLGYQGFGQQMVVSNGGVVVTPNVYIGDSANAQGNSVLVTGSGSTWTNTAGLFVGRNMGFNQVTISDGGRVVGTNASIGHFSTSTGNVVTVTGSGSMWTNTGNLAVGASGFSNALIIANGGRVIAPSLTAGSAAGTNRVEITSGGLLEVGTLTAGNFGGNTISNDGGIFQFSAGAPTIAPNGYGRISLNSGTISFRGVSNANVWGSMGSNQLGSILYSGNNAFRLDNASNSFAASPQNYTFASGVSPSNYVALEMINGATAWRSAWLTIGSGGTMLASNTMATVDGVFTNQGLVSAFDSVVTYRSNVVMEGGIFLTSGATNQFNGGLSLAPAGVLTFTNGASQVGGTITNSGTINVVNANVTFGGPVVISGLYASDPSTNTFTSNVTVTASGSITGSNGDLFVFQKDFLNQSTNAAQFNLSHAAVLFSNAASHVLSVSNSGALDLGHFTNFVEVANNFAIGQLSIASGERVTVAGNRDSLTNALYVGWLDIQGLTLSSTNSYLAVSNTLVTALSLPNINLYYDVNDTRNDWLTRWLPPVSGAGYDLWGGGLLLPIPEPSVGLLVGLVGLAAALMRGFRRSSDGAR